MRSKRRALLLLPAACLVPTIVARAASSAYPAKAVTILVASAAGGPLDEAARRLGLYLSTRWGVPTVIDDRGGAGGTIAASILARAPADGYTLMLSTRGIVINPSLYSNLSFDTANDILPVAKLNEQSTILVAAKHVPARNFEELMGSIRQQPGKFSYGSAGNGGIPHIAGEIFMKASGAKITHVPFKGLALRCSPTFPRSTNSASRG
jgi:tripartite-type tricarboxylate transporter receptor subunit TctC